MKREYLPQTGLPTMKEQAWCSQSVKHRNGRHMPKGEAVTKKQNSGNATETINAQPRLHQHAGLNWRNLFVWK
jgi:hypothetical protein